MSTKSRILKLTSLTLCLSATLFAQAKSQLEFFDSTGANSTAKIGWSGDASTGKFSIETPGDGGSSVTVKNGTLTASNIVGDGSGIGNLNSGNVTGLSGLLQGKANVTRTDSLQTVINGKVDSAFVGRKIVLKVDSAWVTNKFAPKGSIGSSGLADSAVTSIKIADSSIISQKIKSNSIDSTKVSDGSLSWADINKNGLLTLINNGEILKLKRGMNTLTDYLSFYTGTTPEAAIGLENNSGTGLFGSRFANGLSIGTMANTPISFHTNNVELPRLVIAANGNVGIGTSGPTAELEVNGTIQSTDTTINNASLYLKAKSGRLFGLYSTGSADGVGAGKFLVFDAKAQAHRFAIDTNGNVGIGITNPYAKLDVLGFDPAFGTVAKFQRGGAEKPFYIRPYNNDRVRLASAGKLSLVVNAGDAGWGYEALIIDETGNITIAGNCVATTTCTSSDRRFKTNITPLTTSLTKLESLQGVNYDWDRQAFPSRNFPEGKQIGLIAQDVEKVIPEVVHTDADGYKSLSYDKLSALLIEAVKEQQRQIEELKAINSRLEKRVDTLESR